MSKHSKHDVAVGSVDDSGVRWEIRDITPAWAEDMVKRAVGKGKVPAQDIERLASDMKSAWIYNADPIIFDERDQLINGRRRLLACIQAGVSFKSLVFYNISSEVQEKVDTQRGRRFSDVVGILGHKHGRSVGTALRIIFASRNGRFMDDERGATDQQLLGILSRYSELRGSVDFAMRPGRYVPLPLFAALHFLIGRVEQRMADQFFAAICKPKNLRDNDPEAVLFAKLEGWRKARLHPEARIMAAAVVLAWNARFLRSGRFSLDWDPKKDEFPLIAGWPDDFVIDVSPIIGSTIETQRPEAVETPSSAVWKQETVVLLRRMTVEHARDLLSRNTINRAPYQPVIDKYLRDLQNGDWVPFSRTVKVAKTGRLLDGQHFLMAIVESGVEPPVAVAYGLEEEAFETLDRGDRKDFSDVLSGRSVQNAGAVSAAVRLLWNYENWKFHFTGRKPLASNAELDEVLRRHPRIVDCHHYNNRLRNRVVPSVAMLAEYLLTEIDADAAKAFLDRVASGLGCVAGDPAYVLRERLIELAVRDRGDQNPVAQLALIIKAWNALIRGKSMRMLTWDAAELKNTGFPEPLHPDHPPVEGIGHAVAKRTGGRRAESKPNRNGATA